jgi:hypothetical protein
VPAPVRCRKAALVLVPALSHSAGRVGLAPRHALPPTPRVAGPSGFWSSPISVATSTFSEFQLVARLAARVYSPEPIPLMQEGGLS